MRGSTMAVTVKQEFFVEECASCGVMFAVTQEFYAECLRRKRERPFYCPNGHQQWYTGKSDEQLRKEAEQRARDAELRAQTEHDQRLAAERELKQERKRATAERKRVAAGVCPCCNRSFVQLTRHMKTKHPDYTP